MRNIEMPVIQIIRPVSSRRKNNQKGVEAMEFALWALLMMPAFIWTFISGMNFVRYIKASDVTRTAVMLYTKGQDMADTGVQQILPRVANGLNLQVGTTSGATGSGTGNGLIVLTKVMYVGSTCGCTNASKYVMTQRIYVGNRSLQIAGSSLESFAGPAPSSNWSTSGGVVTNYNNTTSAVVSAAFSTLWGSALTDGQIIYVVESFFKPTSTMGTGAFDANGVYNRIFM